MIAHKLSILAGTSPRLSFYSLASKKYAIAHTTQNRTSTQQQNELPPPYPPAALPSFSTGRAAVAPNHGALVPQGYVAGARHQDCSHPCWFLCSGKRIQPHQKIKRWVGPWPYVAVVKQQHTTTNQQSACAVTRVCKRRGAGDEACGRTPSQRLGCQTEQHTNT